MDLMLEIVIQPGLSWQWKADDEFEEIVERELYSEALARHIRTEADRAIADLEARRITVNTHDGQVTLSGSVSSWSERREAVTAAWAAPGVTSVKNDLEVVP